MSIEHRVHARYPVEVATEVMLGERVLAAATKNISEGGVGVMLDEELEDGAEVSVVLFLTEDGIQDPDELPFEAQASVAWAAPSDSGMCIAGLRFRGVGVEQAARLTRFLAAVG
jgi:hypothetical protein